ncbi:MAG: helix-turn-helix transcriptional regulator [Oscillospiraceae bacterium]|nr:helix-turn-helix transcriptional regulator [Oscillospiraceae bacterium]
MDFNRRLTETRRAMGLTQAELAEKLSTTPIAIERWENGETQPDLNDLILLSQALNVSTDHLCGKKNSIAVEGGRKSFSKLSIAKCVIAIIAAIAIFAGGFIIGADIKLKKEKATVTLPETVTVSGIGFSSKNDKLHYQFMPSVTGKGYKYKITFRDYLDTEYTYDVPMSNSGCFGTADDLEAKFIDVVTVTISATNENRVIMIAKNLQFTSGNVSWDTIKD